MLVVLGVGGRWLRCFAGFPSLVRWGLGCVVVGLFGFVLVLLCGCWFYGCVGIVSRSSRCLFFLGLLVLVGVGGGSFCVCVS